MKTRIRVESYLKALPNVMSHTYYPEYKGWFFWHSIQLTEILSSGVYRSDYFCYTLEEAQNCIDEFLSTQKKKHTTTTYIKYP